jgi:hypothetical protein
MRARAEKDPDRVERTQDGRWQVYVQGRPSQKPFVRETLAFAHLKALLRLAPPGAEAGET